MMALPVVKNLDVFKNGRFCFLAGIVKFPMNQLHLRGVEEAFRFEHLQK